jgi:TolB-like protein/Tfp pilus assembly protein PilF
MGAEETTFGPFVLDRSRMALLQDGKVVPIGKRGFALLTALADSDDVVEKAELLEAGWPGAIVEEGNLAVQIGALRKALGQRDDGSDWIITVPRVGYRLVRAKDNSPRFEILPSYRPSLAVLPFENLSADAGQDYFADGIVEDLITALSRFKSFAVVARNSSFVFKGQAIDVRTVGQQLNVRYVLEGSVRRSGERLRVTAQLVDTETGSHIWARSYDGRLEEIFDVQDAITASVSGIVHPKIELAEMERTRRKAPESLDAYELTLRAIELWRTVREHDNRQAVRLLERAIALDPTYALALAVAGHVLQYRLTVSWPPATADDAAQCLDYTERSLRSAQGDGIVQAMAGVTFTNNFEQYDRGLRLLDLALAMVPNSHSVLACCAIGYLHAGDLEKSLACSHRSIELSPADPGQHWALTAISHAHMARGEFEDAVGWAARSLAVNADFDCSYWMLIAGSALLGRMTECKDWLRKFRAMRPEVTVKSIYASQPKLYPDRMARILDGLRLAGLPEGQ